jgi:hypothetical protein
MQQMIFCEGCEKRLRSHGDYAFELFEFICDSYHEGAPMEISLSIHETTHGYLSIIHFLETKGYVVTTDSSESTIQVKPLGIDYAGRGDNALPMFCIH